MYAENITSLFLLCYKSAIHLYLYFLNSIILEIVVSPNLRKNAALHTPGKGITSLPRRKKPHTKQADGTVSAGWQKSSPAHIRRKGALPVHRRAALHTSEERAHFRFTEEQPCTYPKKGRTPGPQKSSPAHNRRTGALPIRGKAQDTQRRSPL